MLLSRNFYRSLSSSKHLFRLYCTGTKKLINVSEDDETGFVTLTMNKPPVNSLSLEFLSEISDTISILQQNKPRGVIVTSFSNKVFSAGLDFPEIYPLNPVRFQIFWSQFQEVMLKLNSFQCPTVAVINGHAPAGGCAISLGCDYRIMVNHFKIGLNETQVGLMVPPWLIALMQSAIGKRQTELAITAGEHFNTEKAWQIGLVHEIASDKSDAINKARNYLKRYGTANQLAVALTKTSLRTDLEAMKNNPVKDTEDFMSYIKQATVQQDIKNFISRMKK